MGTVKGTIKRLDGLGLIRRLSSDPKVLHGYNPSLVLADEVAMWITPALRRAWGALTTAGGARRQSQTFSISVAGEAQERQTGILGRLLDANETAGEIERPHAGLTISRNFAATALVYNYSAPTSDPTNIAAMKLANPASWVTEEYLARQAANPELNASQVLQLHGCVWSAGEDAWMARAPWLARAATDIVVAEGEEISLGFDGSQFDDATVLEGCRISDGHIFTLGVWQKPEALGVGQWEVDRQAVENLVQATFQRYRVRRMLCDPWEWWTEISRWQERWGERVIVFRTDRRPTMAAAVDRFSSAVHAEELTHDDHPRLTEHVLNARKLVRQGTITLRKDRADSPRKIDAAIAAILAFEARADMQTRGSSRTGEFVTF